jgi:hypothetical protein
MRNVRTLDPEKLVKTSAQLADWIGGEFPTSHLSQVAREVATLTQQAVDRAASIRRPNFWLRAGIVALLAVAVAAVGWQVYNHSLDQTVQFIKDTQGAGIYLLSALVFLVTLEIRLKRRKALQAVDELRAMAHIIDMHQLAKDPVLETFRDEPTPYGDKTNQYLHACTALLALVSTVGQLYVENFPDAVAVRAVDDFESMATGLSNKIWNKILSMQRV